MFFLPAGICHELLATAWGPPPEKLLMGLPTYGHTFHLLKASQNELRAEAVGPASPGKYTMQAGFLAYYEVMGAGTSVCEPLSVS